jgi:hypothetical protein
VPPVERLGGEHRLAGARKHLGHHPVTRVLTDSTTYEPGLGSSSDRGIDVTVTG